MKKSKKVKRVIIITAHCENKIRDCVNIAEDDFIICADAGYSLAILEGINPDIVIGDFDSSSKPSDIESRIIKLPEMKDDTDTLSALRYGISLKPKEIIIVGGIGGRFDHTFANIQSLIFAKRAGMDCILTDGDNIINAISDKSKIIIPKKDGFTLSIFSYTDECSGVCISGVKYPLIDAKLKNSFPIGVSNEITASRARIALLSGTLLIIQSALK